MRDRMRQIGLAARRRRRRYTRVCADRRERCRQAKITHSVPAPNAEHISGHYMHPEHKHWIIIIVFSGNFFIAGNTAPDQMARQVKNDHQRDQDKRKLLLMPLDVVNQHFKPMPEEIPDQ